MPKQIAAVVSDSLPDRYVDRRTAAEFLGLSVATLACWASEGAGPRFTKLSAGRSGCVRYAVSELKAFAADPVGYRPRPVAKFHKPETLRREGQPRLPVAKARRRRGKGVKPL